ncbi:succinate dehydrogenase/fumarate reductase flavoprotein subunit [Georgenia soli]|uniref:Succinate dehydrogenase/fumarate reductase flavoprotein subunit n=1 Tax=Georgenia soli TaxID=638953 RepID=A0A2A9EJR7_9MICO|nr:FAD-dependent oxidoreductase [Georgenia soli]PFG39063.1 succinate dehydrogenase/fumarate reductase flavoprotein subunit [Georgenia soli]
MKFERGSIGTVAEEGLPEEVDVAIVGSGGAGLMAALTAAKEGARVLVVESRELVGGATGISAGAAWIPNHGFSTKELKVKDSLDEARRYIYGQGRDQTLDHDLVEKFLETGPYVARYIEKHTAFGWIPTIWPDYRSDIDGASVGRALFPGPYSPAGLGEAAKYVRPALTTGMAKNPLPFWLLGGIGIDDVWLAGPALVGALLEASLRNGVDVRVEAPATRLVVEDSEVRGVVVSSGGAEHTVRATRGVLLASGGFESSDETTTAYLGAPFGVQVSPKGHDGIAVQLAEEVGADLTGMEDAWWMPGVQLPGEELEGRPLARVFLGERALPHSIMVNSKGERFANEALAYDQFGQIMREIDPETGTMPNATAWLIFDQNYWEKFGIFGVTPGGEVPDYLERASTLSELAAKIGVDEVGLLRTVDRFNPEAARARDPEFNRGGTMFDRYFGAYYPRLGKNSPDARFPAATAKARTAIAGAIGPVVSKLAGRVAKKNDFERIRSLVVGPLAKIIRPVLKSPRSSVLGPIDTAPYYALKVEASALGTVGGPRTDAVGRALNKEGQVIPGLYSAGNAGGAPTKGFYGGAGGTISLGLVFGHLAGREAARRQASTQAARVSA